MHSHGTTVHGAPVAATAVIPPLDPEPAPVPPEPQPPGPGPSPLPRPVPEPPMPVDGADRPAWAFGLVSPG